MSFLRFFLFATLAGVSGGWAAAGVYEVLAELERPGVQPQAGLAVQADGSFYAVASAGGAADAGAILRLTAAGALETVLSFSGTAGATPGRTPLAALVGGGDGALWGTTFSGGGEDLGTVYRWAPGSGFALQVAFTGVGGAAPGAGPNELMGHPDGTFYGSTQAGGAGGGGTLFRISASGRVTGLGDFTGLGGVQPGSSPVGALVRLGSRLFGVTQRGGAHDEGTIFSLTEAGIFRTVVEFTGAAGLAPGAQPRAGLVVARDGNLYGTCSAGGAEGFGTLFRLSPLGAFAVLHSFADTDGSAPSARLTAGAAGELLGTAAQGGADGWGVIFRWTSGGVFTVLTEFTGSAGARPGSYPVAALCLGTDGHFYGATSAGGGNQDGVFFRVTAAGDYTRLADCSGGAGWAPAGGPVADGAGSWLMPMAAGGPGGGGTLVKQTGRLQPVAVALFGGAAGDQPSGGLTRGEGGWFGVTAAGGASDRGTFFRYNVGELTLLNQHTNPQGSAAEGPLAVGGDGNFYGSAREGGSSGQGTLFKVTPGGVRTRLVSLTGVSGAARGAMPRGPLTLARDGNFYGVCSRGGAADQGVVFRLSPAGDYHVLVDFNLGEARRPQGGLALGSDGLLYGSTSAGGAADAGTIFSLSTDGVLTARASFTGAEGALPGRGPGALVRAFDGTFWGLAESGGAAGAGTVYQVLADGSVHGRAAFTGLTGAVPGRAEGPLNVAQAATGGLTPTPEGWIYGAVPGGGRGGGGVLFRVRAPTAFENWQAEALAQVAPGQAADSADPDGDGLSNLLEYALGTDPLGPDAGSAPPWLETWGGTEVGLTFFRNPARSDIAISFEATSHLAQAWEVLAQSTQGQRFVGSALASGDGDGPAVRRVTLREAAQSSASRRFLRLRITRQVP